MVSHIDEVDNRQLSEFKQWPGNVRREWASKVRVQVPWTANNRDVFQGHECLARGEER
jgi:hypothetical protein